MIRLIIGLLLIIVVFGIYSNQTKQQLTNKGKDNLQMIRLSEDIGKIIVGNSTFLVKECGQHLTLPSDTTFYKSKKVIYDIPPEIRNEIQELVTQRIYDELSKSNEFANL